MEEKKEVLAHKFELELRKIGRVSGVKDVKSFDEKIILLATDYGQITIKGEGLHVKLLDLEKGEVELTGQVDSVVYSDKGKKTGESLMGHLFR